MSSERGRVIAIFAVVAIVAGGGGYYFLKIYRPAQVRAEAQHEVTAWETRFKAARDCLLGPHPGSPKTSEALAIREMNPDPWDRGSCTPLISKLSRGEAPDTGLSAVEAAWTDLEHAASKAALAFATHVGSSTTLKQDPLPAALDALDGSRAKLRAAAELDALAETVKPLPVAQILPLQDGTDPLTELEIEGVPSAHGFITFGKTASRNVQVSLVTGLAPKIARIGAGSVRGVPDATWGASVVPGGRSESGPLQSGTGELHVGALDPEGAIAAPSTLKLSDVQTVGAAIGTLADGEVVYGTATTLVVAHGKAGVFTAEPPIAIDNGGVISDVDGRAVVAWTKVDHLIAGMHARYLQPSGDGPVIDLPSPATTSPCLTADRAWILGLGEAMSFGGPRPLVDNTASPFGDAAGRAQGPTVVRDVSSTVLLGCTPEAALLRDRNQRKPFEICTDECRHVNMPTGAPDFSAATVVAGKLVAIASHGGVLGVWREGTTPVFYALPQLADPVLAHEWPAMAMTDGKVIDVIARGGKTFVVIRIPAR